MTRLDLFLVQCGRARARNQAKEWIKSGHVRVNGQICKRASQKVSESDEIEVNVQDHYVGRGAHKLAQALRVFPIDLADKLCMDVGSSTGGFTQVMLEAGAARVIAVDVGTDQLHPQLRVHHKVDVHEQTDIRLFKYGQNIDFLSCDVSFISLNQVIDSLAGYKCEAVLLVKPQFEASRLEFKHKGVVPTDIAQIVFERVLNDLKAHCQILGHTLCELQGESGNQEFLVHCKFE